MWTLESVQAIEIGFVRLVDMCNKIHLLGIGFRGPSLTSRNGRRKAVRSGRPPGGWSSAGRGGTEAQRAAVKREDRVGFSRRKDKLCSWCSVENNRLMECVSMDNPPHPRDPQP